MPDKTVAEKLLIKEGYRVLILNEPKEYVSVLGKMPQNVIVLARPDGPADLIQLFVTSRKELEAQFPGLKAALKPKGLFWVTYPKGTSKIKADINRDTIAAYAQSIGLQAVAMVSVDDTWSALRLKVVA
jgi:hypothetical protein